VSLGGTLRRIPGDFPPMPFPARAGADSARAGADAARAGVDAVRAGADTCRVFVVRRGGKTSRRRLSLALREDRQHGCRGQP
jgi:hypothetical protein